MLTAIGMILFYIITVWALIYYASILKNILFNIMGIREIKKEELESLIHIEEFLSNYNI